jgi:hypothetical protein
MDALARALAQFNRAEPDLLFRDALGHWNTRLGLSDDFCKRVAAAVNLPCIPSDAWWATEYPFNCLVGALVLYAEGETAVKQPRRNSLELIKPGREDVDLIISFGTELILIEAKAYSPNDNNQLRSKLEVVDNIRSLYLSLCGIKEGHIRFHFLLTSPTKPRKLNVEWPSWAGKSSMPPWMPLKLGNPQNILQVTRCDPEGRSIKDGQHWRAISSQLFPQDPDPGSVD